MGFFKRKVVWMPIVGLLLVAFVFSFLRKSEETTDMAFSEVIAAARDGRLERVHVVRRHSDITLRDDGTEYVTDINAGVDVVRALEDAGATVGGSSSEAVDVDFAAASSFGNLVGLLISWLPVLLFPFVLYFAVKLGVREALRERETDLD